MTEDLTFEVINTFELVLQHPYCLEIFESFLDSDNEEATE